MTNLESLFWFDGKLVPARDAHVSVASHSLQSGCSVLEGIRCYETARGPAFFRLDAHLRRFFDSAKILGLTIPFNVDEMVDACVQVVKANHLKEAYLRPLAFLGEGELGIGARNNRRHVAVMAWQMGAYLGEEAHDKGVRAKISSYTRNHINSFMCKAKTAGGYVNSVLARLEANDLGFDEAILLDAQGYVSEGTGENVFMVRDGRVYTTPPPTVLAGITRDTIMGLAETRSIAVVERLFTRDELYSCDEAFFTGTAAEITPIRAVDGRSIGEGTAGPITRDLQRMYREVVHGAADRFEGWLHRF